MPAMLASYFASTLAWKPDLHSCLDFMCNAIGNLEWMEKLENPFLDEFNNNGLVPWQLLKSGKIAGMVKSAGGESSPHSSVV